MRTLGNGKEPKRERERERESKTWVRMNVVISFANMNRKVNGEKW